MQENFRKTSTSASLTTVKPLTLWITINCGKFLNGNGMEIPNHLTCLLRNLYAGQKATVRTRHGTTDWFQIGKGVHQGCILSLCLFNLYAEYIIRSAVLDEVQARIKIAGRNINNFNIRDAKGIFHIKMGSIKDTNGMDLTEAEDMQMTPPLWKKVKRN